MGRIIEIEKTIVAANMATAHTLLMVTPGTYAVGRIREAHVTNTSSATNSQFSCWLGFISNLAAATGQNPAPTTAYPLPYSDTHNLTIIGDLSVEPTAYSGDLRFGRGGAPSLSGWHYMPSCESAMMTFSGAGGTTGWGLYMDVPPPTTFNAVVRAIVEMLY